MDLSVSELASRRGSPPTLSATTGASACRPKPGGPLLAAATTTTPPWSACGSSRGPKWFELRLEEIRELLEVFDGEVCQCGHTREGVLRRIATIDEQRARLDEIRAALWRLLGDEAASAPTNGHLRARSNDVTDTLTITPQATEEQATPCGCCIPPPIDLDAEVRQLQARREAVERRLAGFSGGPRA